MRGKRVNTRILVDRLSELPDGVIDIILGCVTLKDAVRTSVLSTKWRFRWTRIENLALDYDFFYDLLSRLRDNQPMLYTGIVNSILVSHRGPVRKFSLFVPDFGPGTPKSEVINMWVISVLRRGVQDLRLEHHFKHRHKVPSYVFQSPELKHLSLGDVIPPHNFRGLSSILSLDLYCESIDGAMLSTIILKCPLLEKCTLSSEKNCSGPFVVNAPKLKVLWIEYHKDFSLMLKNTPNLSTISLKLKANPGKNSHIKCQDIKAFFGAVPKIENVTVTGDVLVEWGKGPGPQKFPERLQALLENQMSLTVCDFNTYSVAQINCLFFLLKNSHKLHMLDISMSELLHCPNNLMLYSLSVIRVGAELCSLKTATVSYLTGDEIETAFIKMILSRSPILEKLYLISDPRISSELELRMVTEIMQGRRASTQAEIVYTKPDRYVI